MEIKKLLEEVVTKGASDIFIVAGSPCGFHFTSFLPYLSTLLGVRFRQKVPLFFLKGKTGAQTLIG